MELFAAIGAFTVSAAVIFIVVGAIWLVDLVLKLDKRQERDREDLEVEMSKWAGLVDKRVRAVEDGEG